MMSLYQRLGMQRDFIFQIGFNKCATTALLWLFTNSGVPTLHGAGRKYRRTGHHTVSLRHPQITIHHNICAGLPPVTGLEDFSAFLDMEHVRTKDGMIVENFKFFDRFAAAYPNAKFILNLRDKSDWLRSRARHAKGEYLSLAMRRLNMDQDMVLARWADEFDRHNAAVRNFFEKEEDRLVVFDIDNDPVEKIVDFCAPNFVLDPVHWGATRITDSLGAKQG